MLKLDYDIVQNPLVAVSEAWADAEVNKRLFRVVHGPKYMNSRTPHKAYPSVDGPRYALWEVMRYERSISV
jgi:hypothetical protein